MVALKSPIVLKQMSHSLNSSKGGYVGVILGTIIGVIKGDTRSLDSSSNGTSLTEDE